MKIMVILVLIIPTIYADSSLMLRAYQMLGLEDDEQTPMNAKQLHTVLRKNPRYAESAYHEPNTRALVMRIQKDLDDALAVIQKQDSVTQLPSVSPLDTHYQQAVNTFLELVGAYTRVIESGQNESTIKEKAQALYNFLETDEYRNKVALFMRQKPIFDFTMLQVIPQIAPLSFDQLLAKLLLLQNQARMLRDALSNLQS